LQRAQVIARYYFEQQGQGQGQANPDISDSEVDEFFKQPVNQQKFDQLIADAKGEAAGILADARKVADAQFERVKDEAEVERARRLEETKRQIDAETKRSLDLIRSEVADLTLAATARVTGKVLDAEDQRRLIDEAIAELDFSALEKEQA